MGHDFMTVAVDSQLVAVLPTGAREQIEYAANFLQSEKSFFGSSIFEIPAVRGATTGAVTLRCSGNRISLQDERERPFAGFGYAEQVEGNRLLRSLLG